MCIRDRIKIEDLKRKYDGVNINELENAAKGNQHEMREAQVEMVKILYYLECTKRYKENKRYAKATFGAVSYTHLRAHETVLDLVCRLLLEKKKTTKKKKQKTHIQ